RPGSSRRLDSREKEPCVSQRAFIADAFDVQAGEKRLATAVLRNRDKPRFIEIVETPVRPRAPEGSHWRPLARGRDEALLPPPLRMPSACLPPLEFVPARQEGAELKRVQVHAAHIVVRNRGQSHHEVAGDEEGLVALAGGRVDAGALLGNPV